MRIKINTNILNDLVDTPGIFVPDKITLGQLFEYLVAKYGEVVRNRVFDNDVQRPNIIIILDGKSIDFSTELGEELCEDDSISIITAIVGG